MVFLSLVSQICTLTSQLLHYFIFLIFSFKFLLTLIFSYDLFTGSPSNTIGSSSQYGLPVFGNQFYTLTSQLLQFLILLIFSFAFNDLIWSIHRLPFKYHWFLNPLWSPCLW